MGMRVLVASQLKVIQAFRLRLHLVLWQQGSVCDALFMALAKAIPCRLNGEQIVASTAIYIAGSGGGTPRCPGANTFFNRKNGDS